MKHQINISVTSMKGFGGYEGERFFDFYLMDSSGKSSAIIKAPRNAKEIEDMIVKVIEFTESLYEDQKADALPISIS